LKVCPTTHELLLDFFKPFPYLDAPKFFMTIMHDFVSTVTELANPRVLGIRSKLAELGLDGCIISFLPDIKWLTEFSGSSGTLVVTRDEMFLVTDGRYREQVKTQVQNAEPFITPDGYLAELKAGKFFKGKAKIGYQSDVMTVDAFGKLKEALPNAELVAVAGLFTDLIASKDDAELAKLKAAVAITDKVFLKVLDVLKAGVIEKDIAAEISYWNLKFGAEKNSFDPIVAAGPRGALPHARPSDNKIPNNTLVVIDMGCVYQGYCSDQTRTVAVGKVGAEEVKVYNAVLQAQLLGIASAKVGMVGKDLDKISRDYLESQGYGEAFGHSLGHSVGMQVHEVPTIGKKTEMKIPDRAVITIEPGVYLPEKFGVRIEDMIFVTEHGVEVLPNATKELITL
jgi:Xaa-Pro aminopeptidase